MTFDEYLEKVPAQQREELVKLRTLFLTHLPEGIEEKVGASMVEYVVPHTLYPKGYHCNPKQALPFSGFSSKKGGISIYHFPLYVDEGLKEWFLENYPLHAKRKLSMGKSCLNLKYMDDIPFDLLGQLFKKRSVEEWITTYEGVFAR